MPYIKTNWIDDVTPISATNMNKIEQGIFDSTWEKIAEQTLVSAVEQVDFASIPSGYKNFRLIFDVIKSIITTSDLQLRFNSDAGINYRYTDIRAATTVQTSQTTNSTYITLTEALPDSTFSFSSGFMEISNFNASKQKSVNAKWFTQDDATASGQHVYSLGGAWKDVVTEINRITLLASAGNIGIGSRFVLWGCK